MPIYNYECEGCVRNAIERNVPIEDRDGQFCKCGEKLIRKIVFTGSVYAPTSGGMR